MGSQTNLMDFLLLVVSLSGHPVCVVCVGACNRCILHLLHSLFCLFAYKEQEENGWTNIHLFITLSPQQQGGGDSL